jgi:hypothetical protein
MEQQKPPRTLSNDKPLKDVEMHINEFGQIVRDVKLEDINAFLNENVPDKKLEEGEDNSPTAA